ncbi:hypothetical protein BBOV_II000125 [Babesia bovis T2Bo]|uniref:hypothetical protein n=1 Tax=Babesia bovis T2Bo TaxID=484906 RepID=UPI001C3535AD|nr:hypothetical protein BBOV_II000125 [Babesia bovis T2Bo]KAG6440166.1 hypothetical protein BBOV_II000125 [Babesia bovis T2Bo]
MMYFKAISKVGICLLCLICTVHVTESASTEQKNSSTVSTNGVSERMKKPSIIDRFCKKQMGNKEGDKKSQIASSKEGLLPLRESKSNNDYPPYGDGTKHFYTPYSRGMTTPDGFVV